MAEGRPSTRAWSTFAELSGDLADLGYIGALLGWDQETMMPAAGGAARAHVSSTLEGIAHGLLTAPSTGRLLDRLEAQVAARPDAFTIAERAQVRELRRAYDRATRLPRRLVQELAVATSHGFEVWEAAHEAGDWSLYQPALARIVDLEREKAGHLGQRGSLYDALLDEFEPGMTVAALRPIFDGLRRASVALLEQIVQRPAPSEAPVLQPFDVDRQWQLVKEILTAMGFAFDAGRLDRSTHPFATKIGYGDVRLTDRADPNDLREIVFGAIHEGGHGLYEQGRPASLERTTVGTDASTGMNESQSRLWENFVGRSGAFWQHFLPRARDIFPEQLRGVAVEEFVRAVNVVRPSLIRTEADEVTYNLHIILRFELDQALIEGTAKVAELPELWNAKMREYLGLTPPDARSGVLQDPHWATGGFGYFPTYTLGNVYAAQLWATIRSQLPVDELLARGELGPVLGWLRTNVHQHGGIYRPAELMERATGQPPSPKYLIDYLRAKYGALYGIGSGSGSS